MVSKILTVTVPSDPVQVIEVQVPGTPGPSGPPGPAGPPDIISIGAVTTTAPGTQATATISGATPNRLLNLSIPQGPQGSQGPSNTLTIGTINTLAEGQAATATITGISPNQVLNLSIPRGYGVRSGGATGDVLSKLSATDYDTGWVAANAHTHTASQLSDSSTVGRSVLTAADATAARAAIGAGTSSLAIGTTSTTAKAGDYTPPDATTGAKGLVQLANHLGGTATAPTVRTGTSAQTGVLQLATTAEATTGTDTAKAITAAGLKTVADTKAALSHTHVATTDLTATGTKSSSTFLRGDNTWAVPPGSGGSVLDWVSAKADGALGDGVANDTTALQTTINANAGKIIYFPVGTYNVSQLLLPSNTHLELGEAVIRRTGNTAGAAGGATIRNTTQGAAGSNTNITVRGGTITSGASTQGRAWSMVGVTNLRVQDVQMNKGSSTFSDWMFHFEQCTTVRIDNCRTSGGTAVGEDGLHIKSSQDMVVTNCVLESGDDALVLVHEFSQTRAIKNITVDNCVLSSKNANALRISVWTGETQAIEDVTISNIVVRPPAGGAGGNCMTIGDQTNTGLLRRINLSNFVVNATGYAGSAINITNMNDSTLSNWRVFGAKDKTFSLANLQRVTLQNCHADTPDVAATGNPQWSLNGGSTHVRFIGCSSKGSTIWGWTVSDTGTADISFIACTVTAAVAEAFSVAHAARVTFMGCTVVGGSSVITLDTTNPPSHVKVIGNQFSGYAGSAVANPVATLVYIGNTDANGTLAQPITVNSQSGAAYTLVLSDTDKLIETTSATAVTLTVPPNSTVAFPIGASIIVRQYGAGQVTIAPGAGVTLRSRGSALKTAGQYAEVVLTKRATNEWVVSGDLTV